MQKNNDAINVLGISIDNITKKDAVEGVISAIKDRDALSIATVNPEFLVEADNNEKFATTLANFGLKVVDGAGIIFMSKLFSRGEFVERITGVDLSNDIFALSNKNGFKVMTIGSENEVAEKTCSRLREIYPKLMIHCVGGGKIDPNRIKKSITSDIKEFRPDILLVGLGAPKQEYFIEKIQKDLKIPVCMGVGGTFDFISGASLRSPEWMRSVGLEWLWRLIVEPTRWRRILNAIITFPIIYTIWAFKTPRDK